MEKILRLSLELNKSVVIMYMGKNGISRRKVKVLRLENNRIYAYCFLRERYRYFIIENILSAQFLQ